MDGVRIALLSRLRAKPQLFGEMGAIAQTLFKHIWQRGAERHDPARSAHAAFLWADASQRFVTCDDAVFLVASRSARVMTAHLTESLHALHAAIGRNKTDSLLANLATGIWHRDSCTAKPACRSHAL